MGQAAEVPRKVSRCGESGHPFSTFLGIIIPRGQLKERGLWGQSGAVVTPRVPPKGRMSSPDSLKNSQT